MNRYKTVLVSCENIGCKHNSHYKKDYEEGAEPKCTLKDIHLIFSFGRSTDYVHELICKEQDGWGYW